MSNDARSYYEQPELWGRPPLDYAIRLREDILALLPGDVASILDVGCGDGYVTNALPANLRVVGIDISETALAHVAREKLVGSATALPFPDQSFDLVMANDVLEHLPGGDFEKALAEIRRVARKYILVSAPFLEDLCSGMTRCGRCGNLYHINQHRRAFGICDISALFAPAAAVAVVLSGQKLPASEMAMRSIKARLGVLNEYANALCPWCGARASTASLSPATHREIGEIARRLSCLNAAAYPDRSECVALFDLSQAALEPMPVGRATLGLTIRADGRLVPLPARLVTQDDALLLEADSAEPIAQRADVWLEWNMGRVVWRYSSPTAVSNRAFVVPTWFNPQTLRGMSPPEHAAGMVCTDGDLAWVLACALAARCSEVEELRAQVKRLRTYLSPLLGLRELLRCVRRALTSRKGRT